MTNEQAQHDEDNGRRKERMPGMLGRLQAAWYLLRDPEAPLLGKLGVVFIALGGIVLMLAYGVSPIDIVPELVAGRSDSSTM